MKRAILREEPTGKIHDLTALMEDSLGGETDMDSIEAVEISVGRMGSGADIELGFNSSPNRRTKTMTVSGVIDTRTVSRQHATITYGWRRMEGFYIKDHSNNGITMDEDKILGERGYLYDGVELYFGSYGPVFYEEIFEELKAA